MPRRWKRSDSTEGRSEKEEDYAAALSWGRLSFAGRISTGAPSLQMSHQWRLALSWRLRRPHLSQTKTSLFGFLTGRMSPTRSLSRY